MPAASCSNACSNAGVEWHRYWIVRVQRARPGSWQRTDYWEYRADTVAELRALVEAARANPQVLAFRHRVEYELIGD